MLYLEQGPSCLVITAKRKGEVAEPDEERLLDLLTRIQRQIKDALPVLRLKAERVLNPRHLPWVARRMVEAAKAIAPFELTAMSAVAGAVSDEIKAHLVAEGFDLALVNNGGDIAAYSALDETISIGTADPRGGLKGPALKIKGPFELGIATSGLGGRSHTKGCAESVTVIALSAAIADAAATFVCNATFIPSPLIKGALSEALDPETDIAGEAVTVEVGALTPVEISSALQKGLANALDLKQRGLITDAVITVKGLTASTFGPGSKIILEERYADQKDCDGC
ncbi:MAG: hypothetical protein COX16_13540 [Deltaproteobacteria bacterium CG23_combo_of_CG06-09_8_20_14_all_51_20]|nr:UPF0280 family protein [bacterium]OIP38618.1 MAG: hypothetical protein AUK25_12275 [Desulfobacteraceae bacterium CG2_30_51_40]PIP45391.1 MAG: hypothetical protein COX16_13540 [Deltaproteobacteria bacterium CG23_combo_of_CG06-09_8_20_14_all_51_20]PIY22678.1 MAG: hypothetical protein COZ11_11800 [Deltaproteobacteria bacterium CG_4_10_14_3_um_filter_51_14]PJB36911.1 MAG: hypothetical protein CO107_06395 [Deltaproteobacteria bacterium CG_4_9_14_3_um_filter_51_14]